MHLCHDVFTPTILDILSHIAIARGQRSSKYNNKKKPRQNKNLGECISFINRHKDNTTRISLLKKCYCHFFGGAGGARKTYIIFDVAKVINVSVNVLNLGRWITGTIFDRNTFTVLIS